jgi:hypothetical protein
MLHDMHGNLMKFASGLGRLRGLYWIQSGLLGWRDSPVLSATLLGTHGTLTLKNCSRNSGTWSNCLYRPSRCSSAFDPLFLSCIDSPSRQP